MKNSSNISVLTNTDIFPINLSEINGKLGRRCCAPGFRSVWDSLTCWIPKGVLKQELSLIQVTTYFGVNNFREDEALKLIFFSKMRNIFNRFCNCNSNFRLFFLVLKITAFEHTPGIFLQSDEKTCGRLSTCWKTLLRFQIWLRQLFSNSICLTLMES